MIYSDGYFDGTTDVRLEGLVTGEVKPMGMSKLSEYGKIEGAKLGESLDSEDRAGLGYAVGMSEGNGFGKNREHHWESQWVKNMELR